MEDIFEGDDDDFSFWDEIASPCPKIQRTAQTESHKSEGTQQSHPPVAAGVDERCGAEDEIHRTMPPLWSAGSFNILTSQMEIAGSAWKGFQERRRETSWHSQILSMRSKDADKIQGSVSGDVDQITIVPLGKWAPVHLKCRIGNENDVAKSSQLPGPSMEMQRLILKLEEELDQKEASTLLDENTRILNDTLTEKRDPKLWFMKYAPSRFSELLVAEETTRQCLRWIKNWESGKVLLLSGPSGVGKTSLIHVVAATAGFAVIETSAQEATTRERIIGILKGAGSCDSAMLRTFAGGKSAKSRPTLLVVDGADELSADVISSIVKLMETTDVEGNALVRRPLVCCCADPYAKSLYPIRAMAFHVAVDSPGENVLLKRLNSICASEGLVCGPTNLKQLVASHQGSMGAILNSLQLVAGELLYLEESCNGFIEVPTSSVTTLSTMDVAVSSLSTVRDHFFHSRSNIQSRDGWIEPRLADPATLNVTLQENLLHVPFPDPYLQRTAAIDDSMVEVDVYLGHSMSDSLSRSLSTASSLLMTKLCCSCVFAGRNLKTANFSADAHAHHHLKRNRQTLAATGGQIPHARFWPTVVSKSFAIEIVPYFDHLCSATVSNHSTKQASFSYHKKPPPSGSTARLGMIDSEMRPMHRLLETCLNLNLRFTVDNKIPSNEQKDQDILPAIVGLHPPLHHLLTRQFIGFYGLGSERRKVGVSGAFTYFDPRGADYINLQLKGQSTEEIRKQSKRILSGFPADTEKSIDGCVQAEEASHEEQQQQGDIVEALRKHRHPGPRDLAKFCAVAARSSVGGGGRARYLDGDARSIKLHSGIEMLLAFEE